MGKDFRILGCISGRGSNLKSLILQCPDADFIAVVSNTPEAPGLAFAKSAAIPCYSFARNDFQSATEFKRAIREKVQALQPDLIVLAGYMQILEPEFVAAFHNRIINIHPSLLPAYPGLNTHRRVLADKGKKHGCTVHLVDSGVDTGAIIAQAAVSVSAHDTPETLNEKVLIREHELYPWVLQQLIRGTIRIQDNGLEFSTEACNSAAALNFIIPGGI